MKDQKGSQPETQEISIKLERYGDIFSDFDMRPYSKRAISVDFLDEIKRATLDKNLGPVELALYMPGKKRNKDEETVIIERLQSHFKRHHHLMKNEQRRVTWFGIRMVMLGILCMVGATYLIYKDPTENVIMSFLVVFLEPAAWFLLWEGMNQILFDSKTVKPELDFYHKMSSIKDVVSFKSY